MTVGAGVWLGHRQIDATLHGKAGVRLSAFTRASSGAETLRHRSTSFGAVRGSALAGAHSWDVPSLLPSWMPFQNNPLGHVPEVRPQLGAGYVKVAVSFLLEVMWASRTYQQPRSRSSARSRARINRRAPIFTDANLPLLSSSYSFEREMLETKAASAIPHARRSRRAEL